MLYTHRHLHTAHIRPKNWPSLETFQKGNIFGIWEYWEEKCFYFFGLESVNACLSKRFCVGNCCAIKAASGAWLCSRGARHSLPSLLGSQ
jgi:hypothetical protein